MLLTSKHSILPTDLHLHHHHFPPLSANHQHIHPAHWDTRSPAAHCSPAAVADLAEAEAAASPAAHSVPHTSAAAAAVVAVAHHTSLSKAADGTDLNVWEEVRNTVGAQVEKSGRRCVGCSRSFPAVRHSRSNDNWAVVGLACHSAGIEA